MDKSEDLAQKIERLIVGGNKELVERIEKMINNTKDELRSEINGMALGIRKEIQAGDNKLSIKMDANTNAMYGLLQDTRKELGEKIDRVEHIIDEHSRLPAHV